MATVSTSLSEIERLEAQLEGVSEGSRLYEAVTGKIEKLKRSAQLNDARDELVHQLNSLPEDAWDIRRVAEEELAQIEDELGRTAEVTAEDKRGDELYFYVDQFIETHAEWQQTDGAPYPTAEYWDSVHQLLAIFGQGSIPADCSELAMAVQKLAKENEINDENDSPMPRESFFAAVGNLRRVFHTAFDEQRFTLESMQTLVDQDVPLEQIAKMYDLYRIVDGHRIPQPGLVEKELRNPGSVLPPDWKHPRQIQIEERSRRLRSRRSRLDRFVAPDVDRKSPEKPAKRPDCEETLEELFLGGVDLDQARRMKPNMDPDEVKRIYREFEVGNFGAADDSNTGQTEQAPSQEELPVGGESGTMPGADFLPEVEGLSWDELRSACERFNVELPKVSGKPSKDNMIRALCLAYSQGKINLKESPDDGMGNGPEQRNGSQGDGN